MRSLRVTLAFLCVSLVGSAVYGAEAKKPATPDWKISGWEVTTCCCKDICPCRHNEKPTHMECEATISVHVDKGNYGKTRLDGVNFIVIGRGFDEKTGGWNKLYIDEKATPAQQEAVVGVLTTMVSSYDPQVAGLVFGKEGRGMKMIPMTFKVSNEGLIREVDAPGLVKIRARLGKVPNSKTPMHLKGVLTEFSPIFYPAAEIDAKVDTSEVPFDHPVHPRAEVEDFTLTRKDYMTRKIGFQAYTGRGGCLMPTK